MGHGWLWSTAIERCQPKGGIYLVYKSSRIITMRNTVWFTNILIKKEEHFFFDMRTIGVQNKILWIDPFGGVKMLHKFKEPLLFSP